MSYRIQIIDIDEFILRNLGLDVDKEENKDVKNKDTEDLLIISLIFY